MVDLETIESAPARLQSSESRFQSTERLASPPDLSHVVSLKSPYGGRKLVVRIPAVALICSNAVLNSLCSEAASSAVSCWCCWVWLMSSLPDSTIFLQSSGYSLMFSPRLKNVAWMPYWLRIEMYFSV